MLAEIIILASAVPIGYLIAYSARDELKSGKKWFKAIIIISIILAIWFYLTKQNTIALTLLFITTATFVSYLRSADKKWTKSKI